MKFITEVPRRKLPLPTEILGIAGLNGEDALELRYGEGTVVVTKKTMTAMDILLTVDVLSAACKELMEALKEACGVCDKCGDCDDLDEDDFDPIHIPGSLLREIGIPEDAKLYAEANYEDGTITVMQIDSKNLLSDIPPEMTQLLLASTICIDSLEELLAEGEVIYGEE